MPLELSSDPSLASRLISRSAFLKHAASSGVRCDKLVVGAAIFHPLLSATVPLRVLIVERAAHEKVLPNVYELPGGHVEDSDSSILHAVAREILEETGLIVHEIIGEFPPMEYSVEKILPAESEVVGPTAVIKTTLQLNFVVKVAPVSSSTGLLEVTLNPQEHQNYAWITKSDLANYVMTEEMKVVVRDALDWGEENIDRFRA